MSTQTHQLESAQVRLTNTGADALKLWLEPWGRLYQVPPRTSVDVHFEAEQAGVPEVIHERDCMVLYAWPGATARVLRDGEEIEQSDQRAEPGSR
jgi:hypothetical protein